MKQFEHGGNIHRVIRESREKRDRVIDFSANINPIGPPEWFRPVVSSELEHLVHYPDPDYTEFVRAICDHHSVQANQVLPGNGTTELLYAVMRGISSERVVIPVPSYVDYIRAARIAGREVLPVTLSEKQKFTKVVETLEPLILPGDMVVIGSPNNPTGGIVSAEKLLVLAQNFPDCTFLIDEAFLDFVDDGVSLAGKGDNIITLHSMTKFYGLPGLRLGYGVFPPSLGAQLRDQMVPWTVNGLAQAVGKKALGDVGYQNRSRLAVRKLRQKLVQKLESFEQLTIFPGSVNYVFCKITDGSNSAKLSEFARKRNILIRRCDNYLGLDNAELFFRVAVRTDKENAYLVDMLEEYFRPASQRFRVKKKTPAIMFQGTCSDAGKSIMTAALCRILVQDGVSVAPFKAQNMSLNSFVTQDGMEMGRAQVVQAQAAKLDPDCRMNPILLKPNSDTGSQVIVCGKPVGNMNVGEYDTFKPKVWDKVCEVYDGLAADHDVIVLEGAGSPGEVNLKAGDIVNMKMAQYADSPVVLVGDIDRGGVYASFVGIMEVLAEWERKLVCGFLVNKFRGQESLLDAAHQYVQMHTGRDVLGVIPHLSNLGLPEEDSVSFKKGIFNRKREGEGIEVVLINLPHISNFTDIEPFLEEPDVTVRVVDKKSDIGSPDILVLPGSKNVIHDLEYLRQSGIMDAVKSCEKEGTQVIGICGGYQMLGRVIRDPYEIESKDGEIAGLGLIDMVTVIEKEKKLTRKRGVHRVSGKQVAGYEIHHGISSLDDTPLLQFDDGSGCGHGASDGNVWGSYLHGIFDSDEFRRWLIDTQRQKKGLHPMGKILAPYELESNFDRLAQTFRDSVDMDRIYKLLGL